MKAAKAAVPAVSTCVHHWVIDTPNGAITVNGKCRRCGAERAFLAAHWEYQGDFSLKGSAHLLKPTIRAINDQERLRTAAEAVSANLAQRDASQGGFPG